MTNILQKYKKQCIIVGIIITVILFIVYLWAMFIPGLWHGDAFLYKQDDGTFAGSDIYAEYNMTVKPADYGTDIDFSVNGNTKHYQIKYDNSNYEKNVEIIENADTIFKGRAFRAGDSWMLHTDNYEMPGEIKVYAGKYVPAEEELFPGYTKLYNWAVADKHDTRGEPYMLWLILLLGIILFLDIKFPNFFWILEHRMDVDGGEPSDWYLFGQKVGRIVLAIGILVCMVMTFIIR